MRSELLREGLERQLKGGLHLGRLQPGDRLGSARQTAREEGADYRTVVAALRGLQRDGLLEIRPRGGIYVGGQAAPPRRGEPRGLGDRLTDLVLDELADGLSVATVVERVRQSLEARHLRAACIECNHDQLAFLGDELHSGFGLDCCSVEIQQLRRGVPPLVRQAHVLVSTNFHAGEVRRCAARLGKACVIATLDPRRLAEVTRLLAERPVYFIGTDPRWASKARSIWGGVPGAERLRTLTVGHDALDVPDDAAVLLMPPARRLLAGTPLAARALPPRGLSRATTREILAFGVHANGAAETRAARR